MSHPPKPTLDNPLPLRHSVSWRIRAAGLWHSVHVRLPGKIENTCDGRRGTRRDAGGFIPSPAANPGLPTSIGLGLRGSGLVPLPVHGLIGRVDEWVARGTS